MVSAIEAKAKRLGLSRTEYLRRQMLRVASISARGVPFAASSRGMVEVGLSVRPTVASTQAHRSGSMIATQRLDSSGS